MNAMLSQTLTWSGTAGASYFVVVNDTSDLNLKTVNVGTATSIGLATLLDGIDFAVNPTVWIRVGSVLPDGSLPSSLVPQPPLSVTIVGFPPPSNVAVV